MQWTSACAHRGYLAFCVNALALEAPRWTGTEFAHLDLGDARYNKRARTLVERLAAKPTVGVPQTRCCA
ncbi:transposase DNA-binding-containing protein [Burkholderia pseudomallei]|uniref:IS4/Tn5 family transposase DNA-binding protein n=1 Tax=Burkholderia pseudomallei TaxID=28450 RepID=UPI0009AD1A23|nr:transposase DNA-binding-containing protein [Burkholderia pseudomallei]MBF3498039.1 hypothetical protein [Burkholderia pseudomallei]MBF3811502.1 hypothetical protein [Burkholderia pseudomallei]MBF3899381.1 hypothetical protein [Burkholderia pseudomallei]MBO2961137.1 hypothetical protein [Burkholderia pseudomallei]MBO7775177.1 hypothetical protein [Burkholderia pseudomallei]